MDKQAAAWYEAYVALGGYSWHYKRKKDRVGEEEEAEEVGSSNNDGVHDDDDGH